MNEEVHASSATNNFYVHAIVCEEFCWQGGELVPVQVKSVQGRLGTDVMRQCHQVVARDSQ